MAYPDFVLVLHSPYHPVIAHCAIKEGIEAEYLATDFTVPDVKTYQGKKIIPEKTTIINEKEYITLTLEDGSTCQLSEGEYNEGVK